MCIHTCFLAYFSITSSFLSMAYTFTLYMRNHTIGGPRRRNYYFSVGLVGCFNFISKTIFGFDCTMYIQHVHIWLFIVLVTTICSKLYMYTYALAQHQLTTTRHNTLLALSFDWFSPFSHSTTFNFELLCHYARDCDWRHKPHGCQYHIGIHSIVLAFNENEK